MRTRKSNFEIVPLSKIAPLLAAKQTAIGINHSYSSRILSVSCDESLARTREMLFSSAGYRVCSALSTAAAVKQSESGVFDLIVIGHSIPLNERRFLLHELRGRCTTPTLVLYRLGEARMAGADHVFDAAEGPDVLLETIHNILNSRMCRQPITLIQRRP